MEQKNEKIHLQNKIKVVQLRRIILYQVIIGFYSKVEYLKALIPFFGMGLSFIKICPRSGSIERRYEVWMKNYIIGLG